MQYELNLETEPSRYYEFEDSEEFFDIESDSEWLGEVSRNSPDYIRWVQSSLNKILGLNLAVDGIMGPQTRSAIRSFQQRGGLVTDGSVGPKTEAALKVTLGMTSALAPPTGKWDWWIIDRFEFAKANLRALRTIRICKQWRP